MAFADTGNRSIKEGILPGKVTLAAACDPGDLLGPSGGTWVLALATVATAIPARAIAGQKGAVGDVITVYQGALVDGVTGATVGGDVYLAEGTSSGDYTQTAPSTTGDLIQKVGVALSATEVRLSVIANDTVSS